MADIIADKTHKFIREMVGKTVTIRDKTAR